MMDRIPNSKNHARIFNLPWTLIALVGLLIAGTTAQAQLSMLRASGTNIVNASGQTVPLRGVNLGGWFVMEGWMTPLDSGGLPDTYSVMQKLDSRFGVATEQSLITAYQQSWITTTDLDNIKNAGFNLVRVPVWWGQFYVLNNTSPSGWRSDAFNEMDWLVSNCASRGIYVVFDMHGAVGSQSTNGDTGQANTNQYWSNSGDQTATSYMWQQIAAHYNGNTTVAGYDLLNEPDNAPSNQAVWDAYSSLYNTIRSADPNHMIFIEGCWGSWNWSMLPAPSQYGWTNVVYEMHEYQYNASSSAVEAGSTNQVNDFNNHKSWNVPAWIGEFNDFYNDSSVWGFTTSAFNNDGMSWSMWTYKTANALNPSSWGWYGPNFWPTTPNISNDTAATIQSDWQQWATTNSFGLNNTLGINGGGVNTGGNPGGPTAPNAPTNLSASAASSSQINLSWTASTTSGVTYSVFGSTSSGFTPSSSNQVTSGISGTTYSNTGLAASTTYYYIVQAVNSAGTDPSSQASATTNPGSVSEAPYGGTAAAIPGTVMAENYDTGGQGVGYNVTSTNGSANGYRTDGVDLEAASSPATGNDLGWSSGGQWFRYTVNVATAGSYTVSFMVTAPAAVTGAFHISNSSGTNLSGAVNVPATGGWQNWQTVTATVTLPAGQQTLTLNQDNGGWNIDSFAFASAGTTGCTTAPSAPTSLAAASTTSTGTTLSWTGTAPSNCSISSYTILQNGTSIGTATGTSFVVTGLSASTTYSFTATATDSVGTSPASSVLTVTTPAGSTGGTISTTAYYTIVNQSSGACVDETGGSNGNGTTLQQWACQSGNLNQQWKFTVTSNGYYEVNPHNSTTAGWDVVNVGTSPGTGMQLWSYSGGKNEQFKPVLQSGSIYTLVDLNSGLCLNVPNSNNGQQVQINTCNGSASENFTLNQQ